MPKKKRFRPKFQEDDAWSYDIEAKLKDPKYSEDQMLEYGQTLPGSDVTLLYMQKTGFTKPIIVKNAQGLHIRMPYNFSVEDVMGYVGPSRVLDVMDCLNQTGEKMSMRDFVRYYQLPKSERKRLLNVLSLEFSNTALSELVCAPRIVSMVDWIDNVWPSTLKCQQTDSTNAMEMMMYPKVQKYCLMSVEGCYTDFHIDFGGTSVWYHVIKGAKVFWLIPPTDTNLTRFQEWTLSGRQNDVFLGELVENCFRMRIEAGNTVLIPSGWIHAVYTPMDSLVFGGNFLHSFSIPMQLSVYEIEVTTQVPEMMRFPYFVDIQWYAAERYVNAISGKSFLCNSLRPGSSSDDFCEQKALTKWELDGLCVLIDWLSVNYDDGQIKAPRDIDKPPVLIDELRNLLRLHSVKEHEAALTGVSFLPPQPVPQKAAPNLKATSTSTCAEFVNIDSVLKCGATHLPFNTELHTNYKDSRCKRPLAESDRSCQASTASHDRSPKKSFIPSTKPQIHDLPVVVASPSSSIGCSSSTCCSTALHNTSVTERTFAVQLPLNFYSSFSGMKTCNSVDNNVNNIHFYDAPTSLREQQSFHSVLQLNTTNSAVFTPVISCIASECSMTSSEAVCNQPNLIGDVFDAGLGSVCCEEVVCSSSTPDFEYHQQTSLPFVAQCLEVSSLVHNRNTASDFEDSVNAIIAAALISEQRSSHNSNSAAFSSLVSGSKEIIIDPVLCKVYNETFLRPRKQAWLSVFQRLSQKDLFSSMQVCSHWYEWCLMPQYWEVINLCRVTTLTSSLCEGIVKRQPRSLFLGQSIVATELLIEMLSGLRLEKLAMYGCPWPVVVSLKTASLSTDLRCLDLRFTSGYMDEQLKELFHENVALRNLRELFLSGSEVSNTTVRYVANQFSNLRLLDLSYCVKITDLGLELLCAAGTKTRSMLRYLLVRGCPNLTVKCFSFLRRLEALERLDVAENPQLASALDNFAIVISSIERRRTYRARNGLVELLPFLTA